jgi:hypothetical protein
MMTKATGMMVVFMVIMSAMLTTCGDAWAGQTWICAVSSAVAVDEDGTVGPPDLGDRERPTFFRIDSTTKELTLLAPRSRRGEITKLQAVHETEGQWLFSGVEHGRGLNLIITAEGRMSLSMLADGVVWSVFGHALPEGESEEQVEGTPSVTPESASGERVERDSDELTENDSDDAAESDSDELTDNEPAARSADNSH